MQKSQRKPKETPDDKKNSSETTARTYLM